MFVFVGGDDYFGIVIDDMVVKWVGWEIGKDYWVNGVDFVVSKKGNDSFWDYG